MAALTPYAQPQPFEEIAPQRAPDELERYYESLEAAELQRRASGKKSRWSRKSFRGVDQHIEELHRLRERRAAEVQHQRGQGTPDDSRSPSPDPPTMDNAVIPGPPQHIMQERVWSAQLPHPQQQLQQQQPPALNAPAPAPSPPNPRKKYDLYNPVGPKFYVNHHLKVPSADAPNGPAVFSKNFPAFPSTPDGSPVTGNALGPRGQSFQQAASSDNLGVADGARFPPNKMPRRSPTSPSEEPDQRSPGGLPRNSSAPYNLNMRMTPSPLSKSVTTLNVPGVALDSAPVSPQHLHPQESQRLTHKLSKRSSKLGAFGRVFGRSVDDVSLQHQHQPYPAFPGPAASTSSLAQVQTQDGNPNRPRPASMTPGPTLTKRTSVFGKLAKKLSLAKHTPEPMVVERRPRPQQQASASSANLPLPEPAAVASAPQHLSSPIYHSELTFSPPSVSTSLSPFLSTPSTSTNTSFATPPTPDYANRTPSPNAKPETPPDPRFLDERPSLMIQNNSSGSSQMRHHGAFTLSPAVEDDDDNSSYGVGGGRPARSDYPEPSDGRASPDQDFHTSIGNLMITNPDMRSNASEYGETPRAPPLRLPVLPTGAPSMYAYSESEAGDTASLASLRLHVVNPSAPTPVPNPEELARAMAASAAHEPLPPPPAHIPAAMPAPAVGPVPASPHRQTNGAAFSPPGAAASSRHTRERSQPKHHRYSSDLDAEPRHHSRHSSSTFTPNGTEQPMYMTTASRSRPDVSSVPNARHEHQLSSHTSPTRDFERQYQHAAQVTPPPERAGRSSVDRERIDRDRSHPATPDSRSSTTLDQAAGSQSTEPGKTSKYSRRLSRKPPPSLVPTLSDMSGSSMSIKSTSTSIKSSSTSRKSTSISVESMSTASLKTMPETSVPPNIMEHYASGGSGSYGDQRDLISVNGQAWEVVPVDEVVMSRREDARTPQRSTSRVARLAAADMQAAAAASARQRTKSVPEPRRDPGSPTAPALPPKSSDRDRDRSSRHHKSHSSDKPLPVPSSRTSARPVSEVPSIDDARPGAREAFSAERMRKGMSAVGGMNGSLPIYASAFNGHSHDRDRSLPAPPAQSRDTSSFDGPGHHAPRRQPSLGSGHTNFVMSRPGAF
ncbi:hypothetical protein BKA62DRAFT_227427 [Auriculariales sp. MPI-PUGE-AT-0066]|nr:hypothetical protein BKA62DRAFT_227427 [Auriculariales sp. MPI-PUGE-AT-0066]